MTTQDRLTRWAAVAFSARCAEHMAPLLDSVWPDRDDATNTMFLSALNAARQSARDGKLSRNYPDVGTPITCLAGNINLSKRGIFDGDGLPSNRDTWGLIEDIATVFAKTAETAHAHPRQAHEIAIEGFTWAQEVAGGDDVLISTMHREFESLLAYNVNWGDRTTVEWSGDDWIGRTPVSWWKPWQRNVG